MKGRKKLEEERIPVPTEIKTDCAGYDIEAKRCHRKSGKVNCYKCHSYETKEAYIEKLAKAKKRLASLPAEQQWAIAHDYYNGRYDWLIKED